jgi:hypothetical protein
MHAQGITPISKWSDDHIFFCIPHESIPSYNALRHLWHSSITGNGGRLHSGHILQSIRYRKLRSSHK